MAVISIGGPGFDILKLSGFHLFNITREQLITRFTNCNNVLYNAKITVSTYKLTITDGSFKLEIGKSGLTEYVTLELHAADEMGNNIPNMKVADAIDKMVYAVNTLHSKYGIDLNYTWDNLVITKCEVNTTFPLVKPFGCYRRVLTLTAYAILSDRGNGTKHDVSAKEMKNAFIQETLCVKKASYTVKIYNKTQEICKKLDGVLMNDELMRVEILYSKRDAIQNDFGTIQFCKLTDEMVRNAFISKFNHWKERSDRYLEDKHAYCPGLSGSQNTIANLIVRHFTAGNYVPNFLADLAAYEAYYIVPLALDIQDISVTLNLMNRNHVINCDFPALYEQVMKAYNDMPEARKLLNKQREMYDEVFTKIQGCPASVNIYY